MWHTFRNSSYTDELWFIALRLPGGVEGYFERLSPMLRQAGGPSPHAVAALPPTYGIEFDVDSIQPCSRSN
ncbi:MAG TPA: hypothetical protein VHH91_10680 [Vicinamibacterales bacterium]|nr:hypothetical protein [Vicinamibacterales bacterium]